jgi:NTE family protein
MSTFFRIVATALILVTFETSFARPRVGLVLGGGGARGIAHVGVIKVLEDNHIPVDCVIGTSVGSLVGAAYASGRTTDDMRNRIETADWARMFYGQAPRQSFPFRRKQDDALSMLGVELGLGDDGELKIPFAAISTQAIEYFLRSLTYGATVQNFDKLPIPYRAVATDFVTGEMVVLKDGDLVTAMRASMAVPGIFPAVPAGGRTLVDGGLVRNLPVDVARQLCADVVIAVDVGAPPLGMNEIKNILSVGDQYTRLMMIQNVRPQVTNLSAKDVLIVPEFGALGSTDFDRGAEIEPVGEAAAKKMLPQLKKYAVSPAEYEAWSKKRT